VVGGLRGADGVGEEGEVDVLSVVLVEVKGEFALGAVEAGILGNEAIGRETLGILGGGNRIGRQLGLEDVVGKAIQKDARRAGDEADAMVETDVDAGGALDAE